jgi:IMP dehydrogenase
LLLEILQVNSKPIANKDVYGRLRVAAIGVTDAVERAEALVNANVNAIIMTHGRCKGCKYLKSKS